jgi:hypothetical protein
MPSSTKYGMDPPKSRAVTIRPHGSIGRRLVSTTLIKVDTASLTPMVRSSSKRNGTTLMAGTKGANRKPTASCTMMNLRTPKAWLQPTSRPLFAVPPEFVQADGGGGAEERETGLGQER